MLAIIFITALLGWSRIVIGWGAGVHPVIGHLAELYFLPDTTQAVQALLAGEPKFGGSIGEAANWADHVRNHLSEPWHFIDAQDDPPNSCSLDLQRDCGETGCVVSAIANHTQILRQCIANNDVSYGCDEALKYLVHWFGDITQPLHCSSKERGGNQIEVKCNNRRRNFHSCWDTYIPGILEDSIGTFDQWPALLKSKIDSSSSDFLSPPSDWVTCMDLDNIEDCAYQWAKETNALTCSFAYAQLPSPPDGQEICTDDYLSGAFPIIETQAARGGLRFAVFMNLVVTGQPGWGGNPSFKVQVP